MKKVLVILSVFAFVLAFSVDQSSVLANTVDTEYAKIDKDPKADGKSSCQSKEKAAASSAKSGDCSKPCGTKTSASTQGTKGGCCSSAAKAACGSDAGKKMTAAQAQPEQK